MATTIKSPQEGYTGTDTYGPLTLEFKYGVATTDETLSAGHKAYFKKLGFKLASVKSEADSKAKAEADAKADAERKAKEEADKQDEADAKAAAAEKKEGDK